MKLVEQQVKLINLDLYHKIEYAARVCYNSLDKITEDSYKNFISDKIELGHYSVLEHSNICLSWRFGDGMDTSYVYQWLNAVKGESNSRVFITQNSSKGLVLSGNVRSWIDFFNYDLRDGSMYNEGFKNMLQKKLYTEYPMFFDEIFCEVIEGLLEIISEDEACGSDPVHKSYTFEILTNRAISHQLVRHRDFSFAQESQRYCNYTRPRHGGEIKAIVSKGFLDKNEELIYNSLKESENAYFKAIENKTGLAEDARMLLPNAVSTKIVITARKPQLYKFFDLRCDSHAQKEIRDIACAMRNIVEN